MAISLPLAELLPDDEDELEDEAAVLLDSDSFCVSCSDAFEDSLSFFLFSSALRLSSAFLLSSALRLSS